jgi:hypothetical protein
LIKTVYQKPEIRDSNDNIIQQGTFGKNTALANATNDGWIDYVANDLEFLYDLAKDEVVPVPSLPASGQTNKTYLLTTTGVSYRWSGTQWVAVSSSEAVGRAENAATLAEQWATKTDGVVADNEYSAKYYANAAQQSADDAQDVADDMADHLAQIDQNTGGVSANSKRIGNIEKLLQGNLYDYDTDDDTAYTKSVPAGAMPYAGLEQIGGKTVVWNQLGKEINSNNWNVSRPTFASVAFADGVATVTITASSGGNSAYAIEMVQAYSVISGHKYYMSVDVNSNTSGIDFINRCVDSTTGETYAITSTDTWLRFGSVVICNASDTPAYLMFAKANSAGTPTSVVYKVRNAMLIDLTLMFGAGNEPSTVAEFEAMFPASYYPYNAGTLLSAGVTEVVSKGANLIPTYTTSGNGNGLTWTANADGSVTINGTATATVTIDAPTSTWKWDGITPCWLSGCPAGGSRYDGYSLRVDGASAYSGYDIGSGIQLTMLSGSGSLTKKTLYFRVVIRSGTVCNNLTFRPMLNYGTSAKSYAPYIGTISTYTIPASIQALEGYGWSAGTVYNYVDFERKVFVKNIGSYTFDGTETWRASGSALYVGAFDDALFSVGGQCICNAYVGKTAAGGTAYSDENNICWLSSNSSYNRLYIIDSSQTTSTIGSYMSGKTVYYSLAAPIETDISAYLTDDNLIEVEGNGTLTFPNSNGTDYQIPVPSEETYMIDLQEAINNG